MINLPKQTAIKRNKKLHTIMICMIAFMLLLAAGTWLQIRKNHDEQYTEYSPKKFDGGSAHWDQKAIPISMQCGACHEKEFKQWASSDHAWAFRKLDPSLDAQAFHHRQLYVHGSTLHFTTQNDRRCVFDEQTARAFVVAWATGRTPLVQYLVPSHDGGYHTLSAAWDVYRKEWFDIFGYDMRQSGDWGHWTGRGMNWNAQCAWCHMSLFHKNYDTELERYRSVWVEPGVTCIQCHGPLLDKPESGTGCMVSTRKKLSAKQIGDNCAACHARRDEFDHDFTVGDKFDDHFQLVLPVQPGIFWPNGMQRDEDYCETGLRLSRMGHAGVSCLDCHDPHTGMLKLSQQDNSLCLRCHGTGVPVNGVKTPIIDIKDHTPCPQSSAGARCVECHMPESLYMARDPRRDHSFNSPDPAMSVELGIPNACTMCHTDKTDQWAQQHVATYYKPSSRKAFYQARTRAVQGAYDNKDVLQNLRTVYHQEEVPAWRATLLELMEPWAHEMTVQHIAQQAATSSDALIRTAAAKLMGSVGNPSVQRLLNDPIKMVRLQAAWWLRDSLPVDSPAMKELVAMALHQADQPSGAMKMANIELSRQNIDKAEHWFQQAIKLDPGSVVVHRDYAVFLATQGKHAQAVEQMQQAIKLTPQDANLWYLLGLGQIDNHDERGALKSFTQALAIEPTFVRALVNRALLNERIGNLEQALQDLENCIPLDPHNPDIPCTLAILHLQQKNYEQALKAAQIALQRDPQHSQARQIVEFITRQQGR